MRVYPPTILRIDKETVSFSFDRMNFLAPANFSFKVSDISSLTRREIGDDEYVVFEIRNPVRKFQVSAFSTEWEDTLKFDEAMENIAAMLDTED